MSIKLCNLATACIPLVKKTKYTALETKDSTFFQAYLNANLKKEMDPIHPNSLV